MKINDILQTGANVQLVVSAHELKEAFLQWAIEHEEQAQEAFMTSKEVCDKFGITRATLWRWEKNGYLKGRKFGKKTLYYLSEIKKALGN